MIWFSGLRPYECSRVITPGSGQVTSARKANAGTNLPHIPVPEADRANSRVVLGVGRIEQARLDTWLMVAPLASSIENTRLQLVS